MSKPSLNAFKGYTYQQNIYMFFVAKMDIEREIAYIRAEITANHNFDDIFLQMNDYENIVVQTKNYQNTQEIVIKESKVIINKNESIIDNNSTNLFIVENYNIEPNGSIFGLPAYKENNVYILSLSIDEIYKILSQNYEKMDSRFNQILHLSSKKCASSNNGLSIEELPPLKFFSNELLEQTIKIRNFKYDNNNKDNVLFIIGKPGVGKSHLVNELDLKNSIIYRFWISEQDPQKNDRLEFKKFIKQLSIDVFGDLKYHSTEEMINKLYKENKTIIIDGLDHVENYNIEDLQNYLQFIKNIDVKKINLLVFTRPLQTVEIDYQNILLNNWNESETFVFLKEMHKINDYLIEKEIYDIGKGYPIITNYLAHHYILNEDLPKIEDLSDVNDYYRKLISNVKMEKTLTVFSLTRSYITLDELLVTFGGVGYPIIMDFLDKHKYLFEIALNRISLIHDSFNTFLIKDVGIDDNIKSKFYSYVKNSIDNFEIRFLSRIDSLYLDNDFKKELIKKYVSFDIFNKILLSTIDYESIRYFYQKMNLFLEDLEADILDIYQYYNFILILNILSRDGIEQRYGLLFQMFNYLIDKGFDETKIYSSKTLFGFYNLVYKNNPSIYTRYIEDRNYSLDSVSYDFNKEMNEEEIFFDILSKDILEEDLIELEKECIGINNNEELHRKDKFSELLVKCYISKINYKNYREIILNCLNGKIEEAQYELNNIFIRNGIRSFMTRSALNKAVDWIKQLGFEKETNDYLNCSLKDFIIKYAEVGSFTLSEKITAFIRLANEKKRKIDIESICHYFSMYYNRKDYTALTFSNAFRVYNLNKLISLDNCMKYIINTKQMSEKGIRHILEEFINLLSTEEIYEVDKLNYFINDEVNISDLKNNVLMAIDEKYFYDSLYKYIDIAKNSSFRNGYVRFFDIENFINSDYKNETFEILKEYDCTIYDIPLNINIDYEKVEYSKNDYSKKDSYSFDKGYLSESEFDYIKTKKITPFELSKMLDGWNHALPYPNFYKMFDKYKVQEDILPIIYNSLINAKNKYRDNGEIDLLVGNIPLLLYVIEYPVSWIKLYESFCLFLEMSQIRIEENN